MKSCTKHFMERWTQRIVGITTEKEMKDYINQNRDMINEHANKTFEYAEFIYKGQIGDNVTRNYHIKDDLVFVTNTTDDAFITIYKVDLGFTPELNATVRKGLMEEIARLREEEEKIQTEILYEVEDKNHQISAIADEAKVLEEQLETLKRTQKFLQEEVKFIKSKALNTGLELKRHTLTLVNSKEYKSDLQTMK